MAAKKKKTSGRAEDIKREPFRQKLPVTLKPAELADRAQRAAHLIQDHDAKAEAFKAQAKENKVALDRIATEMRDTSRVVREGKEYRDVVCERIYNWTDGSVRDVRCDTGEVIAERAMSEAERQKSLPFPPPESSDDLDDEFEGDDEKKPEAAPEAKPDPEGEEDEEKDEDPEDNAAE